MPRAASRAEGAGRSPDAHIDQSCGCRQRSSRVLTPSIQNMSATMSVPLIDSQFCDRVIRLSCTKMLGARHERGGAKLHKNLLVLHLLKRAREEQRRIEEAEAAMYISDSLLDEEEDECIQPPLEFSVTDDEDGQFDADAPLIFATEATEMCEIDDEEPLKPAPALSSALNEALARIGSSVDRKRKPSKSVSQPQKKSTKTEVANAARVAVALSCK